MRKVFADTVGMIARWDTRDQWHADAKRSFRQLNDEGVVFVTTRFVLLECGNAGARRPYRAIVARFAQEMDANGLIIRPTEEDWNLAWEAYRRGAADQAGIVDHVSFQVMRRIGVREAFTNDRHFTAAGFKVLF